MEEDSDGKNSDEENLINKFCQKPHKYIKNIIYQVKSNYKVFSKDRWIISLASRINP